VHSNLFRELQAVDIVKHIADIHFIHYCALNILGFKSIHIYKMVGSFIYYPRKTNKC